jgi:hypothetical protein
MVAQVQNEANFDQVTQWLAKLHRPIIRAASNRPGDFRTRSLNGVIAPRPLAAGYLQLRKIPSVPSAASATSLHRDRPVTFAPTTLAQI